MWKLKCFRTNGASEMLKKMRRPTLNLACVWRDSECSVQISATGQREAGWNLSSCPIPRLGPGDGGFNV